MWLFRELDSQSAAGLWTLPCPSWSFTAGYNRELLPGPGTILRAVPPSGRRPTDQPTYKLCGWTSVCPSSRSGPTSPSKAVEGGVAPFRRTRPGSSGNNSPPAESHFFLSSSSSPSSTLTCSVPFFSFAHCCLVACDCASSGFLRARPR